MAAVSLAGRPGLVVLLALSAGLLSTQSSATPSTSTMTLPSTPSSLQQSPPFQNITSENSSCAVDCGYFLPQTFKVGWFAYSVTSTITHATIIIITATDASTTQIRTSTIYNELPAGYTIPTDTDAAGTKTYVASWPVYNNSWATTTLTYPQSWVGYSNAFPWSGTLSTSTAENAPASCVAIPSNTSTIAPLLPYQTVPPYQTPPVEPQITQWPSLSSGIDADPRGWLHFATSAEDAEIVLLPQIPPNFFNSAFPDQAAFKDCTIPPFAIPAPEQVALTAEFATETLHSTEPIGLAGATPVPGAGAPSSAPATAAGQLIGLPTSAGSPPTNGPGRGPGSAPSQDIGSSGPTPSSLSPGPPSAALPNNAGPANPAAASAVGPAASGPAPAISTAPESASAVASGLAALLSASAFPGPLGQSNSAAGAGAGLGPSTPGARAGAAGTPSAAEPPSPIPADSGNPVASLNPSNEPQTTGGSSPSSARGTPIRLANGLSITPLATDAQGQTIDGVDGQTLAPGAPGVMISGTAVSVQSGGANAVYSGAGSGTSTVALGPEGGASGASNRGDTSAQASASMQASRGSTGTDASASSTSAGASSSGVVRSDAAPSVAFRSANRALLTSFIAMACAWLGCS